MGVPETTWAQENSTREKTASCIRLELCRHKWYAQKGYQRIEVEILIN